MAKKKKNKYQKIEEKNIITKNQSQPLVGDPAWQIDEFTKHTRDKRWYIIASVIATALIVWAIIDKNYLFALIIVLCGALIVFYDNETPRRIRIELKYNGILMGKKFYNFQAMSKFYIIYKPEENLKKIFFEFKNPLSHRLVVSLEKENPIIIRNYLLQYLEEDLEKEDEPLSEGLSKIFKI